MHASFERLRLALGMEHGDVKAFVKECAARQAHPIDPVMVDKAPVQEEMFIGDQVSVEDLPICTYHEKDAGKYITAGLAVMRDPETGINNVGIYRHMVHEKNLLGVQLSETADGNIIWQKYEKRGLPCPVAIVIGHHPAFFIGSLCFSTLNSDEIKIAGGMLQRPIPLVRCKTIPLDVPADAEIVLECEIRTVERRAEAPFGEYPGTYGPRRMNPVLEIKAITRRKNPIYQNAFVGHSDNLLLSGLDSHELHRGDGQDRLPHRARRQCAARGPLPLHLLCRDRENAGGRGQACGDGGFRRRSVPEVRGRHRPRRRHQQRHRCATRDRHRVRADTDTFMVPYAKGSPLDPASYDPAGGSNLVTKMGIDATRKSNYPDEIAVPGFDQINMADFIPGYRGT